MKTITNNQKEILKQILINIRLQNYYVEELTLKGFEEEYINSINNLYEESINKLEILYNNN